MYETGEDITTIQLKKNSVHISYKKMDELSIGTLRRIEQNDDSLTHLYLGKDWGDFCGDEEGGFNSNFSFDFSRLGASIGNNTHLTQLDVDISDIPSAVVEDRRFFCGLKRNTSIRNLYCDGVFVVGGVVHEILKVYQDKNTRTILLTFIFIVPT